jgi:ribose 5-phosphate isomerase B
MRIAIGCDEAAFELKEIIKQDLLKSGYDVDDFGTHESKPVLYADIAFSVAKSIADGKYERGILLCGTGIGMSIAANKVMGIRAAVCHDPYSAERARKSNNAQIIALGARIIGVELAKLLVDIWLKSEFEGGGSTEKIERISKYERGNINTA